MPSGSWPASVGQAIRALGLSFHDVLALGDAENDLDFFEASGWTACPINAVPELKDRADWIFPGGDGAALAQAIPGPILGGLLPVARSRRHRVALGWSAETAAEVTIPERGVNVLIQGDPPSGKSWAPGGVAAGARAGRRGPAGVRRARPLDAPTGQEGRAHRDGARAPPGAPAAPR